MLPSKEEFCLLNGYSILESLADPTCNEADFTTLLATPHHEFSFQRHARTAIAGRPLTGDRHWIIGNRETIKKPAWGKPKRFWAETGAAPKLMRLRV
jgi:hypothetical protein